MGKHRSLFEFSEDSRVQGYSEGSERSICTPNLPAQINQMLSLLLFAAQREEERASGVDVPELTEVDILLEEIRKREKSAEEKSDSLRNEKKAKDEKEKGAAEEIRRALRLLYL